MSFAELQHALRSDQPPTRGDAMAALLVMAGKDPAIREAALPLFQAGVSEARDCRTALDAARGVELILGPEAARGAWVSLLHQTDEQIVINAANELTDPSWLPKHLALLARRKEPPIRAAVLRSLGRTKHPSVYDTLLAYLARKDTRGDAIQALEDYGDPRAIPHLKRFLSDRTRSSVLVDRGERLTIGTLATAAVQRLEGFAPKSPPPQSSRRKWSIAHTAYVPLIAAVFELPWTFLIIILVTANQTSAGLSRTAVRILDLLGMAPAVVGLLIGLIAVVNWRALNRPKRICLILGSAACLGFVRMFGIELLR